MPARPQPEISIRDAAPADFSRIVELNDAEAHHTSALDIDKLAQLDEMACYHRVAVADGAIAAFLLAIRGDALYENDNYRWFAERLQRFVYVDRIVVDARSVGLGIGGKLYRDLFADTRAQGIDTIACEYNIEPPNPASQAFHARFGFTEKGTQWLAGRSKRVSLQVAATGLPNPAILRQAQRTDIPAIQRVRHAVRENRLIWIVIADEDVVREMEVTGRGWVIQVNSEVVAFAIGNAGTGNIWALFVDPAHEGKGYGRRLHDEMLGWLWSQGLKRLWLSTDPGTRAEGFYLRAGWQRREILPSGEVLFDWHAA